MARSEADALLARVKKFVGKTVRKQVAKNDSKTTFTAVQVGEGIKQGYLAIQDQLGADFKDLTNEDFTEIGRAGVKAVTQWADKKGTSAKEVYNRSITFDHISYISKRDVARPHVLCKNACVEKLEKILGRALKGATRDKDDKSGWAGGITPNQSEKGMLKSKVHKLHQGLTTVGSARLAAGMRFLTNATSSDGLLDYGGFANSTFADDINDYYSKIEFLWVVEGQEGSEAKISLVLDQDQYIEMNVHSMDENAPGSGTYDWKNLRPIYEKAIYEYIRDSGHYDQEGSKSIRQHALAQSEHIVMSALTKGAGVKAKRKTKSEKIKRKKTKNSAKNSAKAAAAVASKKKSNRRKRAMGNKKGAATQPLQLIGIINKQLPQTVLKNMGAPGLVNRTGTFARSAEITDIVSTPQGFPSIGYTYDRQPYGVFEDGAGAAPWANGQRDPRKIIDRSIREIAAQFAIGRFYTRRQ
jgi:hypothetical protein